MNNNQEISEKLIKKIEEGRQYRPTSELFRAIAMDPDDDSEQKPMIAEGHACTFNQPYNMYDDGEFMIDEQVDSHAFDECDEEDVIFQYDHEGRVMARNKNQTLTLSIDNIGLMVRADLSKSELGPGLYRDISSGMVDKMSFGFKIGKTKTERVDDAENNKHRYLITIMSVTKLYDVSAVSIPANDGTDISARSFCDGVIKEIRADMLRHDKLQKDKTECLALLSL